MGKRNNKKQLEVSSSAKNTPSNVFFEVLIHCLLIIFAPIVTFFLVKNVLFDRYLETDSIYGCIYSAVSAVIVLHVALGLYVYRAYFREDAAAATTAPIKID